MKRMTGYVTVFVVFAMAATTVFSSPTAATEGWLGAAPSPRSHTGLAQVQPPTSFVDAGPDLNVQEGDVVELEAVTPAGTLGAPTLAPSRISRNLPNDTQVSVEVRLDGVQNDAVVGGIDLRAFDSPTRFNLISVMDLSTSTLSDGCGGDENGDGDVGSILDCEVLAVLELNNRLAGDPRVRSGLVVFSGASAAADLSPADGPQLAVRPSDDEDASGVTDFEESVRSVFAIEGGFFGTNRSGIDQFTSTEVGQGTNFLAAATRACSLAQESFTGPSVIAFMSDGEATETDPLADLLPCGDAAFYTFAVGAGSSCDGGVQSLSSIAELTGGSCTEIIDITDLPEILAATIAPEIISATLQIDGGDRIDVSSSLNIALPASGAVSLAFDQVELLDGATEVCLEVVLRDEVGETPIETCSDVVQSVGDVSYAWTNTDRKGPPVFVVGADTATPSFVAFDNGRYTFEVVATNEVGQSAADTLVVEVANVEPSVTTSSLDASVGGVTLLAGEFTDPGWADTHAVTVDWGDGTTLPGAIGVQGSGEGTFFASHRFDAPGEYDITVTLADNNGDSDIAEIALPTIVTGSIAVWAEDGTTAGEGITFQGAGTSISGTVHSNASIAVIACDSAVTGQVEYGNSFDLDPQCAPTDGFASPEPVPARPSPLQLDVADYAPGAEVATTIGRRYFDTTSQCRDGRWRVHDQDLVPGVYYVDCDVDFINASGEVTIISTGEIRTSGANLDFRPYFGSLLFLTSAEDDGVSISSTNSTYEGAISSLKAIVDLGGADNTYECGIYGASVSVPGVNTTIAGGECGARPTGIVSAVIQPELIVALSTEQSPRTPGDTAQFQLSATNTGARLVMPGIAGIQNIDEQDLTIDGLDIVFERRATGSPDWQNWELDPTRLSVAVEPVEAGGVTYAPTPSGTVVEPGAIAIWSFQAIAELTPAELAIVTDPTATSGFRVRTTAATDGTVRSRELYRLGRDVSESLHAQSGVVVGGKATFLSSLGSTQILDIKPLDPGEAIELLVPVEIEVPAPPFPGESTLSYISRLRRADQQRVVGAAIATGTGDAGRVIASLAVDSTSVDLPIVDIQKVGPTVVTSGGSADWTIRTVNLGSQTASDVEIIDVFGEQELPVNNAPTTLEPSAVVDSAAVATIPADTIREFTNNTASVTWSDANGNQYGPVVGEAPIDIYRGPALTVTILEELAIDADGNGVISPGDTLSYTATLTNSGDTALSQVELNASIDPNTTVDATTVTGGAGQIEAEPDTLTVAVPDMDAASQTTVEWQAALVDPFPPTASSVSTVVSVETSQLGVVPASPAGTVNPGASVTTPITVPFSVLAFEVDSRLTEDNDSSGTITPGDKLTYTGRLTNTGNVLATGATMNVALDPGISVVDGEVMASLGSVSSTASSVDVTVGDLAAGGVAGLTFNAIVANPLPTGITELSLVATAQADGVAPTAATGPGGSNEPAPPLQIDRPDPTTGSTGSTTPTNGTSGGTTLSGASAPGVGRVIDDAPISPGAGIDCQSVTPAFGTEIAGATPIFIAAAATDGAAITSWRVDVYPAGVPGEAETIGTGTGAPPAVLATFDPSTRNSGTWTVVGEFQTDSGGLGRCETSLVSEGLLKLGRFTTSYLDLNVPVGGIPMQVIRSYDTQDRFSDGDFGPGWTLSFGNFTIQTNTQLGRGPWSSSVCGGFFLFSEVCYESEESRYITVTWPDGRVESFDFTPSGFALFPILTTAEFTPRDGATSSLRLAPGQETPSLSPVDGNMRGGLFGSGDIFSPRRFILTDRLGTEYTIDRSTGLVSQVALDGTTLTIGADGIRSSLGPQITFARDADGRITQLTDLAGGTINYTYDANGDLVSVADQNGSVTTFGYLAGHYLDEIQEPGGGQPRRMIYDDEGRLTSITDASGNVVEVSSDLDNGTEITTSPDGNLTTITTRDEAGNMTSVAEVYDGETFLTSFDFNDRGQVTGRTDPQGNTWSGSYDAKDNLTSFTDADGNTTLFTYDDRGYPATMTDALNQTTTFTYDERGNLVSTVDARGVGQSFTYDGAGNELTRTDSLGRTWSATYTTSGLLETISDPLGRATSHTYDANGRLATTTAADGGVTQFSSDGVGNLVQMTDPLGRVTAYTYDAANRLTSETDPAGFTMTYTYNGVGRMTSMEDGSGRTWNYDYEFDRLTSETAPDGGVTSYNYDGAARVASIVDALGRTTNYEYNEAHRRTAIVTPFGAGETATTRFGFNANGQVASITNGEGESTTSNFDALRRVVSRTDALGRAVNHTFDASGNVASQSNANGETTTFSYDLANQLTARTDPTGAVTTYTYDPVGNLLTMTDPVGRVTSYGYDSMSRRVSTTMPSGDVMSTVYDLAGQAASQTSAAGVTQSFGYDLRGLLTSTTDELGNARTIAHDGAGRRTSVSDARGNTTTYGHDAVGRPTTETDPLGGVATMGYDLAGQLVLVTDPNGALRSMGYDDAGYLTSEADALGRTATSTYDRAGRQISTTDARGITVTNAWDAAGQLTGQSSPTENRTFGYDLAGRMTSMTDPTGTTSMGYDAAGRTLSVTNAAGSVSYSYNAAGQRLSLTQPQGTVSYGFDTNGYPSSIEDWRGETLTMVNDADGRVLSETRANGVTTAHTYDAAGRLTAVAHTDAVNAIESFTYSLDGEGNRTSVTSAAGVESYVLDPLHRITSATYADGTAEAFAYDAAGYRISHTDTTGATTTSTFDAAGQLVSDSDGTTYTYDAAGNLLGNSRGETYAWNDFGRMVSASANGASETYTYDAFDQRAAVNGEAQLWDSIGGLPTLISAGTDNWVHGPHGVVRDGSQWLLDDGLGSVRLETDGAGIVGDRFDFTAFGTPRGTIPDAFGFTGEQHDPTGLIHLRARQYDPNTGRFASVDPVQPGAPGTTGWNLYAYAGNNPTNWTDPSGELAIGYVILLGALLGGLLSFWTCDQSGNGWWKPSLDLDGSCVVTEILLGGIFAGLGGFGAGWAGRQLGRQLLVGCAWGAAEGATGAGINGATNNNLNWESVGVGAVFGCLLAGLFTGAFHFWTPKGPNTGGTGGNGGQGGTAGQGGTSGQAPSGLVNETAGGLTNLGRGSARGPAFFDDFSAGQGFSGVYDEATGSILAFPSGPGGVVPRRGGHAVVNQRLTQAVGAPGGQRAGFTAILQTNGALQVQWLSRSVNPSGYVPDSLRPAIIDALSQTSGRTVVG